MFDYYIVHAFTENLFHGNPAGVCILKERLPEQMMQKIAYENNLPETAFLLMTERGYSLRWFTPLNEIDLCGHATLAAAYVVLNYLEPGKNYVEFQTASGMLSVCKNNERYDMTFPARPPERIEPDRAIIKKLKVRPVEIYSERDLFVLLGNEDEVRAYIPDYSLLSQLKPWLGIVITAKGTDVDFVSRYFCPELAEEDPVTGSAHCTLTPLWSRKLHKNVLTARQLSRRGGVLYCEDRQDKVVISGHACLYLKGRLNL